MKKIYFLFLFFAMFIKSASAEKLKVFLEPSGPVVGEVFNIVFRIETSGHGTPKIFFDPGRAKVSGGNNRGTSIRAQMINGKFIAQREVVYSYELSTSAKGPLALKNIRVEINGKKLTHPNISTVVRDRPHTPKGVLLMATPSKSSIYLGEGLDVTYYLYYRYHITGREIQAFPKLNKFIKRMVTTKSREETVELDGTMYRRFPIYAVRLYPEKVGMLSIDPLGMKIEYIKRGGSTSTPFGSFGLRLGSRTSRNLESKTVKVEVKPLPVEGVPTGFTGLVGDHEFKLTLARNKFLVNDAIEMRLEVTGPGALENFDAPKLYQHQNLEEFDTKSAFSVLGERGGKKTFDYTFLARGPLNIEAFDLKLAVFDPDKGQYVEKIVTIPSLVVSGLAARKGTDVKKTLPQEQVESAKLRQKPVRKLLAPDFAPGGIAKIPWFTALNIFLVSALLLLLVIPPIRSVLASPRRPEDEIIAELKKKVDYVGLYKLFVLLDKKGAGERPLGEILRDVNLSKETRIYFENLLEKLSKKQYGSAGEGEGPPFRSKYFKEMVRLIRNENH